MGAIEPEEVFLEENEIDDVLEVEGAQSGPDMESDDGRSIRSILRLVLNEGSRRKL